MYAFTYIEICNLARQTEFTFHIMHVVRGQPPTCTADSSLHTGRGKWSSSVEENNGILIRTEDMLITL